VGVLELERTPVGLPQSVVLRVPQPVVQRLPEFLVERVPQQLTEVLMSRWKEFFHLFLIAFAANALWALVELWPREKVVAGRVAGHVIAQDGSRCRGGEHLPATLAAGSRVRCSWE
jgi:hypothetical protein